MGSTITDQATQPTAREFSKYRRRGAYHWDALSRQVRQHDCFTAARYDAVLDLATLAPHESVLDVGSGDGALTWLIRQRLPRGRVIGVEPEAVGRQLAVEQFAARGATAEVVASIDDVESASIDVVICAEVIEHVPDPSTLLADIHRVLRPGGRAIISTPVRLTERPIDSEHVGEFFPEEFARMIEKHLRVEAQEFACPVFAMELYYWRPRFFFGKGVIRLAMNLLSAWFHFRPIRTLSPHRRYHMVQVVRGIRT